MPTSRGDSSSKPFEDSDSPIEFNEEEEEEAKDTSEKLESEGHDEDPKLASSTPGRFESNSTPPCKEGTDGNLVAYKSSAMVPAANNGEASNTRLTNAKSRIQEKHTSSEEKEHSESLIDGKIITFSSEKQTIGEDREDAKVITFSPEKQMIGEDTEDAKDSFLDAHGSHQSDLRSSGSIGLETKKLLQTFSKELPKAYVVGGSSMMWIPHDSLEKDEPHLHSKTELKMTDDSSRSSMLTSRQRPRSSSPGASPENLSKRPAMVCSFYAQGWCIKGNSCRFLHQKESSKEDLIESSGKGDVLHNAGYRGEAERFSSSQEQPDPSNSDSASKSQSQIYRDLVRQYGWEGHGSPHFHGGSSIRAMEEFHKVDVPIVGDALNRDEYKGHSGVSPQFDPIYESLSANEQFLSRRYLNEGTLQLELPRREFLNNSLFSKGSSLTRNLVGDSSTSSSLYLNNSSLAQDRSSEDFAFGNHHGSHSSYSLTGTVDSSFQFSSDHLNIHKPFDFDKGYHSSRSVSLPRSSSPYLSRPEQEYVLPHNVPRNLSASVRHKAREFSWEPSEPFRPSFHWASSILSSLGGPCNPFHDSKLPRDAGNIALQASERTGDLNVPGHSTYGDPLLYGSRMIAYNVQKSSFPQPHQWTLDESTSSQATLVAASGHTAPDGGNNSLPKPDKPWIPYHVVESSGINGSENCGIEEEMARTSKESKALRIFRTILVDFVKDLVKPSWQKGQITKDAHKIIVKKTVEKVLGALQPHEVPSTSDSINQYLSTSRPKLLKLVEGYIGKYGKSQPSNLMG